MDIGRIFRGIGANSFSNLATIAIQLISVPVFINYWGVQLYAEWLLLSTIPAYLAMSDIGFTSVAGNQMTMRVSAGDHEGALVSFQSTWFLLSSVSVFVFLLVVVFLFYLPSEYIIDRTTQNYNDILIIICLLTLYALFSLQGGLLFSGYRCEGNYALGVMINAFTRLFENFSVLIGVLFGADLVTAALILVLSRLIGTILSRIILQRRSPWIVYGYKYAEFHNIRELAPPAIAFMVFPLGNALRVQGMLTVVGIMLGGSFVVIFSAVRTLTNFVSQAMNIINSTIWNEVSMAYGQNDISLARKLHRKSCQASIWMAFLLTFCLYFMGEKIINIWTLGKVPIDQSFFNLMLIVILANSIWFASSVIHVAINKHKKMALYYLSGSIISILIAVPLIHNLGLIGIPISLLIIDFLMSIYVIRASVQELGDSFNGFIMEVLNPIGLFSWVNSKLK